MDILFIEDQPIVSEPTALKMRGTPGVSAVVVCNSAEAALNALQDSPDRWGLIFLDLEIPGAVGLSLALEIKRLGKEGITCVMTGSPRTDYIAQIKAEGFRGYILKSSEIKELNESMNKIIAGETVFPDEDSLQRGPDAVRLTTHQRECLQLVQEGLTTKEIARVKKVHPSTVNYHIESALKALQASSRLQAVHKAVQLGIITLSIATKPHDDP